MNKLIPLFAVLIIACQNPEKESAMTSQMFEFSDVEAPKAPKKDTVLTKHGDDRPDPYYWLNERGNQEVIDYLEAENSYREKLMGHLKDFQGELFEEMKGRIKEDDQSVPYKDNGYYYISRYEKGLEYPIYSRKKGTLTAPEEMLLDVNVLATSKCWTSITSPIN